MEVNDRDREGDQQVNTGVADHRPAQDGDIGKRRELQGSGQRGLHFERRTPPDRLARHDQAGDDSELHLLVFAAPKDYIIGSRQPFMSLDAPWDA